MGDFGDKMNQAILMLQAFTRQKTQDGDLTDTELCQLKGEIDVIVSAIDYELELRQEARDAAGGHPADQRVGKV